MADQDRENQDNSDRSVNEKLYHKKNVNSEEKIRKLAAFSFISDTDQTTLVIIGLTIGGILLIVFIIIVTVVCVKQRKKITR